MESQFWIKAWQEGRTGFHQADFHPKLLEYFPKLNPQKGQKILVPLCGKSKDLLWLASQGLQVHGVELYEEAVKAFFQENALAAPQVTRAQDFVRYSLGNITINCGDFFKFQANGDYDYIYDRAALVALPAPMRKNYAQVIKRALKKNGHYLLVVYEYDQSKIEGPPFSVDAAEIHELYSDAFEIELRESKASTNDGPRLTALGEDLQQKVYLLKR